MINPDISIIVPHYDDLASLDRCLSALVMQTLPPDRYEIIVADNMSPCGEAAVRDVIAGRAKLTIASQAGAGPARNAGVAASRGRLLAFTDADCIPENGWLAAGTAALEQFELVGGCMTVLIEGHGTKSGAEAFEAVFAFNNRRYVEKKLFTVTANLFCTRAVFDATGPFRVGVSEDLEWCLRARQKGFQIGYCAGAVAGHPARPNWAALLRKWERLSAESFELACTRRGGRLRWFASTLAMPMSILPHLVRVMRSPALSGTTERARAAATLARLRLWRFVDGNLRLAGLLKK
jgi:glycosyltransferase involved in cell wall biosynthesis